MSRTSDKEFLFIAMAGTIDSEPYPDPAHPPENAKPLHDFSLAQQYAHEMMHAKGLSEGKHYDMLRWKARDSKDFTSEDMIELADIIKTSAARKIIVTHGTDAMVKNTTLLKQFLSDTDKIVIFTGAMVPLANGEQSDGVANLKTAVRAAELLEAEHSPGVYIAFHNKIFDPSDTIKDTKVWQFKSPTARDIVSDSEALKSSDKEIKNSDNRFFGSWEIKNPTMSVHDAKRIK